MNHGVRRTKHTTRLEFWRLDAGLTMAQLGEQLGVSEKHVQRLCAGEAGMGRGVSDKLRKLTGDKLHRDNFDQDPGEVAS